MFALAEIYTLVHDGEHDNDEEYDMTMGFQYYHHAYWIYQPYIKKNNVQKNESKQDCNHANNNRDMEIQFAHCSIQLGVESVQYLHDFDQDIVEYENAADKNSGRCRITNTLSNVMETSILTFNHQFWMMLLKLLQGEN